MQTKPPSTPHAPDPAKNDLHPQQNEIGKMLPKTLATRAPAKVQPWCDDDALLREHVGRCSAADGSDHQPDPPNTTGPGHCGAVVDPPTAARPVCSPMRRTDSVPAHDPCGAGTSGWHRRSDALREPLKCQPRLVHRDIERGDILRRHTSRHRRPVGADRRARLSATGAAVTGRERCCAVLVLQALREGVGTEQSEGDRHHQGMGSDLHATSSPPLRGARNLVCSRDHA